MSVEHADHDELVNVLFRATREERRQIHYRARLAGFDSTGTYLRSLALGQEVEPWKVGRPSKASPPDQDRLVS